MAHRENRPFRLTEPTGKPDLGMDFAEWERQEQARRARLGPEVAAAEARTRADYEEERMIESAPVRMGGRHETQAWRDKLRAEAALDAQGLPESSPDDPPQANESGNRLPMR